MANWFYYDDNGQKQGPIDNAQLKALAEQRVILPETLIETEDGRQGRAGKVKGLFPAAAASNSTAVATIGCVSPLNDLKTAAQQGNPEALFYLGCYSLNGYLFDRNEQNKELAARCFTQGAKSAAAGSPAAICCAGICSEYGLGVEKDDLAAVKLYENAAAKGFAFANLCLAHAYSAGGEFIEKDPAEAASYASTAFKQLMDSCKDESEAIQFVALQCNYSVNFGGSQDIVNIEYSRCPKEFGKAFEACLKHFNTYFDLTDQILDLNDHFESGSLDVEEAAGDALVDGALDAVGGRRWMYDLKGGLADAGISLITNTVSASMKADREQKRLEGEYRIRYRELDSARREAEQNFAASAERTKKIAVRYGTVFNGFDPIIQQMREVESAAVPVVETAVISVDSLPMKKKACLIEWWGWVGYAGELEITESQVLFHAKNGSSSVSLPICDIVQVAKNFTPLGALTVETRYGRKYKFMIMGGMFGSPAERQEVIDVIESLL
jgi:hypothetical protein